MFISNWCRRLPAKAKTRCVGQKCLLPSMQLSGATTSDPRQNSGCKSFKKNDCFSLGVGVERGRGDSSWRILQQVAALTKTRYLQPTYCADYSCRDLRQAFQSGSRPSHSTMSSGSPLEPPKQDRVKYPGRSFRLYQANLLRTRIRKTHSAGIQFRKVSRKKRLTAELNYRNRFVRKVWVEQAWRY